MSISSIQRGFSTSTGNITISSVDMSKSFVSVSYANAKYSDSQVVLAPGNRGYGYGFGYSVSYSARLTSSTNLEISSGTQNNTTSAGIAWEVIEYA